MLLHVFVTEVCGLWSSVPVEQGEEEYVMREFAHFEAVLVVAPAADVGGAAHLGQADLWDGGPIADAGRQQDRLLYPVIPDPKGVPRGWTSASVSVQTSAAPPDAAAGVPAHRGQAASEQTGQ